MMLMNAEIIENQYLDGLGIQCTGSLRRESGSDTSVEDYFRQNEYVGAKIHIDDIGDHDYLVFYGKKNADHGQPSVFVYDEQGLKVGEITVHYSNLDNE